MGRVKDAVLRRSSVAKSPVVMRQSPLARPGRSAANSVSMGSKGSAPSAAETWRARSTSQPRMEPSGSRKLKGGSMRKANLTRRASRRLPAEPQARSEGLGIAAAVIGAAITGEDRHRPVGHMEIRIDADEGGVAANRRAGDQEAIAGEAREIRRDAGGIVRELMGPTELALAHHLY